MDLFEKNCIIGGDVCCLPIIETIDATNIGTSTLFLSWINRRHIGFATEAKIIHPHVHIVYVVITNLSNKYIPLVKSAYQKKLVVSDNHGDKFERGNPILRLFADMIFRVVYDSMSVYNRGSEEFIIFHIRRITDITVCCTI